MVVPKADLLDLLGLLGLLDLLDPPRSYLSSQMTDVRGHAVSMVRFAGS